MKYFKFLFLLLFLITSPIMAQEKVIRITNGEWPPYLSENLKHNGIVSRIVKEAFALEGVKVKYGFFPWKRSLTLAERGEWDGSAVWLKSPDREKIFYFSDPVIQSSYVFFHLRSFQFDWKSVDDLKNILIGGTLGYDYGEEFMKAEKEHRIMVERTSSDETNFNKLLHNRFKIFPLDIEVGYTMIHKQFKPEVVSLFTNHPLPLRQDPLHLILSKKVRKNEQMIELFNRGLRKLQETGKIEEYLNESRQGGYRK